jgi:hypothetical protein
MRSIQKCIIDLFPIIGSTDFFPKRCRQVVRSFLPVIEWSNFVFMYRRRKSKKKKNDYPSILHIESLIGNHKYLQFATDQHRCDLRSPLLRTMAYCSHSRVLLSSNNNTQCKMKLVRLRMKGLTPTYDVVAGAVLPLSPSRVGRYKITKWVVYE